MNLPRSTLDGSWHAVGVVVLAGLMCSLAGCASRPLAGIQSDKPEWKVSLPSVKLADSEYIQSVVVDIQGGRIVSINRLLDDWGTELSWDNPGELSLRCEAGHFVSGLSSLTELADFITVQANGYGQLRITAKVHTSSTDPTGRPDREFTISQKEMVLSLVNNPSGERRMRPNLMK